MLKFVLTFTVALIAFKSVYAQGTFNGAAAGQMAGAAVVSKRPDAQFIFDQTEEMQTVNWGDTLITVDQVVDKNSARISVRCGQRNSDTGGMALHGRTLQVWYEGPTEGWVDGKKIYDLVAVRKAGTHRYSSIVGVNTIPKVKHFTEEEMATLIQSWKDSNSDHVTLSGKTLGEAPLVITGYKSGKVTVTNYDGTAEIRLSKLDKKSKAIVKDWRTAQKEKK